MQKNDNRAEDNLPLTSTKSSTAKGRTMTIRLYIIRVRVRVGYARVDFRSDFALHAKPVVNLN